MSASDWNDWSTAPADGRVFEASNGVSQAYVCICEDQAEIVECVSWFGLRKRREIINKAGKYLYVALPGPGGYIRLNSRTGWKPNKWRDIRP